MPYLDESGEILECDRCGIVAPYTDKLHEITFDLWQKTIFRRRMVPDFFINTFCYKCAIEITPLVYRARDIDEVNLFINHLMRAINEKRRNQNHRATSAHAGERG